MDDESVMPDTDVQQAKLAELENWRRNRVYEVVLFNHQEYIFTKWVITEKAVQGGKKLKVPLVVRGFEERAEIQTDPPTCSKECQRLILTIMASRGWQCNPLI